MWVKRPWKKARLAALKVPKGKPVHKTKTTVADMVHQDGDDVKPSPVFNLFGKQAREVSEAKDMLKLAVVELFAGLRTTHGPQPEAIFTPPGRGGLGLTGA